MAIINTTAEPLKETPKSIAFRWPYVVLPAVVLIIAVIISAVFYGRLTVDVAYHFSGGVPDSWLSRNGVLAWALGLQLGFMVLALGVTLFITGAARRMQLPESPLNRTIFGLMGNMMAIPQVIFGYATLDIFLYNIYQKTLPALWIFALAVMLATGAAMVLLFARAFVQAHRIKIVNNSGSESDVRKQTG